MTLFCIIRQGSIILLLIVCHAQDWMANQTCHRSSVLGKVPPHGQCHVNNVCIMVYLHCYVFLCWTSRDDLGDDRWAQESMYIRVKGVTRCV